MSDWRKVESLLLYSGKGITPKYVEESSIIVLNQKCIRNNKIDFKLARYTDDNKKQNESKFVQIGDILFNSTGQGTAGRCAFVDWLPPDKQVITDSHILTLRLDNYYEAQCLSYSFHSKESEIQGFMDGSTGQGELDKIRVFNLLTSLTEDKNSQKKIAKVLSDLDAKIELNNKINEELEAMAKLIYDYWFVQFDFPISKEQALAMGKPKLEGKPYKSSGGKMVFNEELKREIPEGWEGGLASDLFEFNPTLSLKNGEMASYIDMSSLPENGFMTEIPEEKEFNGGMKFQNDDIAVARITPCLENGKTGLITLLEDEEVGFGSTEFIIMRGKEIRLRSFGACLSRSERFRKYAISRMTGTSGRKRVNYTSLELFKIPIPTEDMLNMFEERTERFFDISTNHVKENNKLTELRDWLLPMLMNGQVTVGEAEEDFSKAAEPEVEYKGEEQARILPFVPRKTTQQVDTVENVTKNELQAGIMAFNIMAHARSSESKDYLGHVKMEKTLDTIETQLRIDLGRKPKRLAAGPADMNRLMKVEHQARKRGWFDAQKREDGTWFYNGLGTNSEPLLRKIIQNLGDYKAEMDRIIQLYLPYDTKEVEIFATTHAAWHDLIARGYKPTDVDIVLHAGTKEGWHESKEKIPKEKFYKAIEWLKENELVPDGKGKMTEKK